MIPAVEGPPGEKAVLHSECKFAFMSAKGACRNRKEAVNIVMPVKTGIRAPGSGRDQRGESPLSGNAHPR